MSFRKYQDVRNSSIELLRIIAAYLIVLRHFVGGNATSVWEQPFSVNKVFLEGIIYPSGKVGVVLFFLISAWFLCEKSSGLKQSFRRAWILERELLFYSIGITLCLALFHSESLTLKTLIGAILPTSTELWWYPTSYMVFLLLHPFLTVGLHALGQVMHRNLCVLCILLWSVLGGVISFISFDMTEQNVMIFVYLYILVTYWRWYGISWHHRFVAIVSIIIGYAISVCSVIVLTVVTTWAGGGERQQTMLGQNEWMLPIILIGFGMFALFKNTNFQNRAINNLAKSTFAVYLISAHPAMPAILWGEFFDMNTVYNTPWLIPYAFGSALAVYVACVLIDYVRRGVFALTIDRYPGKIFNMIWERVAKVKLLEK